MYTGLPKYPDIFYQGLGHLWIWVPGTDAPQVPRGTCHTHFRIWMGVQSQACPPCSAAARLSLEILSR